MKALEIISAEHRGMWRLADTLDAIRSDLANGGDRSEAETVVRILEYIESYSDRAHHPKEDDYLFRHLRQRCAEALPHLDQLQQQHREEPARLQALIATTKAYAQGVSANEQAFFADLERFASHLRGHITLEETTVLKLARASLTEEDWAEIDAAFLKNDDPLFGSAVRAEFEALHRRIVQFAPEPFGLGGHAVAEPAPATAPRSEAGEMLLQIRGLTSHYGSIQALHGIDIDVRRGQLVALVGANGAGKTTLLRTLSGVQPTSGGSIHFRGQDITRLRPDRRVRLGICQSPEGRQVFGPLSIEDNLRLGAYTRSKGEMEADLQRMYALFPILEEKRRLPAGTLSGGQQQMLAIARALMGRPQLLLLDEPSMGLAPLLVEEIFRVIRQLKADGMTLFLVEQNAHAALAVADIGYVLETGRTILSGPGATLLQDEQVQKAYLGM